MDLIKDILAKNNYIVEFEKTGPSRFLIKTPKRIFLPKQEAREITITTIDGVISVYENGTMLNAIEIGSIGMRVGIYYLLTGICRAIRYSPLHIACSNGIHGVDNVLTLLPGTPFDSLNKEQILTGLVAAYIENNDSLKDLKKDAKENQLEQEFKSILSLQQFFTKREEIV